MTCLVLLLAVCIIAANGEEFYSLNKVFELFRDRQSAHCDVGKYEDATGSQLDSCDIVPFDGLVPDDTVCDFTTGYVTKTTQYCGRGFWFTVQGHPHYPYKIKREVDALRDVLKQWNKNAPEGDRIDISTISSTTTETTTVTAPPQALEEGWRNCPSDPILVTPNPGETEVDLKQYFDEPEKNEVGWDVTLLNAAADWIEIDGQTFKAHAVTYNGQTKKLSYRATNTESGNIDHCEVKFRFEVKKCEISDIKNHANDAHANVACDNKYWGVHGERCNMTCRDMDKSTNDQNKNVYAKCEVDEDGSNTQWNWYAEDKEENGGTPEPTEQPNCEPIVCKQDAFAVHEHEEDWLECKDDTTGNYAEVKPDDVITAGANCRRPCLDKKGEVCGGSEDEATELNTYNYYTCDYNGEWTREEPAKCGSSNVWQNCVVSPMVNHGKMCCSDDRCTVTCDDGFSPSRGSKPNADCRLNETDGTHMWQRYEYAMDGQWDWVILEDFPGDMCKATCGSLPVDFTNMEADSVTSDCSGTEIGERCNLHCSYYSILVGSPIATCEFNAEERSAEWIIPDGEDEPLCEAQACEDLFPPDNGTVSCSFDETEKINICNVTCDAGFTHNLMYKTQFKCDMYETGKWPDKGDIPKCVEARTPEVKLTFEANAEASRDECNRLSESVNVDEIINRTISWCPSSCTCTPGDITPSSEDENDCLVRLPVSFVCGGEGLEKQIAMLWSLIHAAVALDEDIAITKYLSIPNIETTCPEGWSLHMSDDVEPRCIQCNKGSAYNANIGECERCSSGNSVDGSCVDYAASTPEPVKCKDYDKKRKELKFTNCSNELTGGLLTFETYCMVECEDPLQHLYVSDGTAVYAKCTKNGDEEEGAWQYTPTEFSCEVYPCPVGQFSESGNDPCVDCEIGYYSDTSGSTVCIECPEGSTTAHRGSSMPEACVASDSITCFPGYFHDVSSTECKLCPFSAYCDGVSMYNCPDKTVTEDEGSITVADCVAETWTVIGDNPEDPDERSMTVTNMVDLPNLGFMEFRMCTFSRDLLVEFNVSPYVFLIHGDGHFEFLDSDYVMCEGDDFFHYTYTDCGTNVTIAVNIFYIEINYGGPSILCWPQGGGDITPIDVGLDNMTISVRPKSSNGINMQEMPLDELPHFAFMALYTDTNINWDDDEGDSHQGDTYSEMYDSEFGDMPPDPNYYSDDSSDVSQDDMGSPPSGSGPSGEYPSDYLPSDYPTGDYPPSGSGPSGEYPSDYPPTGPSAEYPSDYLPSDYPTGDYPPSGSGPSEEYSSDYPTSDYPPSGSGPSGEYPSDYPPAGPSAEYPSDYLPSDYPTGDYPPSGSGPSGEYPSDYPPTGPSAEYPSDYLPSDYPTGDYPPSGSGPSEEYSSDYPTSDYPPSGSGPSGEYPSDYPPAGPSAEYPSDYLPSDYPTGDYPPSGSGPSGEYPSDYPPTGPSGEYPTGPTTPDEYPSDADGMGRPSDEFRRRKRGVDPSSTTEYISSSESTSSTSPTSTTTTFSSTTDLSSTTEYISSGSTEDTTSYYETGYSSSDYDSTGYDDSGYDSDSNGTSSYESGSDYDYGTSNYESGSYSQGSSGTGAYGNGSDSSAYDFARSTPNRNCYENLMINARFSDRDVSEKPYSCRLRECRNGNYNPDRWTCKPCAIGQYYNYTTEDCSSCPNYGVTRQVGATDLNDCHSDSWSVSPASDAGPSAVITGLTLSSFCAIKFHVHKPVEPLNFNITFHQYRLEVKSDLTFSMFLRDTLIIDGSEDNLFEEKEGWLAILISFDEENQQLVLEYGSREQRSFSLTDDYSIPVDEEIEFNIQVMNVPGSNSNGAMLYLAYLQVYEACDGIDDCLANEFAHAWNYIEGSGASNNQPYSCPDTAEHWSCKDPKEQFGGQQYYMQFACTNGRSLYSECAVSCTDGYFLHGDTHIRCKGTHWAFDMIKRGVPSCKIEMPETPTCREPSLPGNVEWTQSSATEFQPQCSEAEKEFKWGYDASAIYTCNMTTLEWEPSTILIPECFQPEPQRSAWAMEYEIYNPRKLSCEEIRRQLEDTMQSHEVTNNSPMGWDAKIGIFKLHCGLLEGAGTETSTEDDPVIRDIRDNNNCGDCDPACYEQVWTNIRNHVESGIQTNINDIFDKIPQMQEAKVNENQDEVDTVAEELYGRADNSNKLLNDGGIKELIQEVDSKAEDCPDFDTQKQFGILSASINSTVADLSSAVKANSITIEQQAQSFGAPASGGNMKVEVKITVAISEYDLLDIQQTNEMLNEFVQALRQYGQTVVNNSSKTDVICGEGNAIASKGQCETKSCKNDETFNENSECEKCNKWTSIIDETGQCMPCPEGTRVTETKDGRRICTEPCPAGSYSAEGFTDPNTRECTPCSPGDYQENVGSTQCAECPGIQTNFESGSTSCTSEYDLCLTNTADNPVLLHNLNQHTDLSKLTFSTMVKKTTESFGFGIDFDDHTAELDESSVTICGPDGDQCAMFQYNDGPTFLEYTQFAFTIGEGERRAFIDGKEIYSDSSSYTGEFTISADSDFKVYSGACITNWYISGEKEDDLDDLSTPDGVKRDTNMFRNQAIEADEFDDSVATTSTSAYTGQRTDYCASDPCKNGGSCSQGMGRPDCSCPTGFTGQKCEKEFEEQEPVWSDWRSGSCSVTCGAGTLTQERTCATEPCTGDAFRSVSCIKETCKECPALNYDETKVTMTTRADGSKTINEFSCSGNRKKFAKTGGTESPNTVFECGPGTNYQWDPNPIPPQCTTTEIPKGYNEIGEITFVDRAAVDAISCVLDALEQWKNEFIAELERFAACMTNTQYQCQLNPSDVEVSKCTARKKRAASGSDVILTFSLALDDQAQVDLQNMYDNNIVSPGLLEVVQAIADLDNVVNNLKSLTVTINNVNYTVDPATVTATSSITCKTGQYADGASCVNCGVGTYQDTTSGFCVLCPKGEYQAQEAQTSCDSCPTGETTLNTGSTNSSYCESDPTYTCSGSSCGGGGGGGDEDSGSGDGKTIGIAIGAAVGALVLIGGVSALIFRAYAASKSKASANLTNQNLIYPKIPKVPEKKKLYNEIVNPHFVPPPKPVLPAYSQPVAESPGYLSVGQPDARAVTPPGTVLAENA